jgi:hypothetical protein
MPTKSCIYYTSNRLDEKIMLACQRQLRRAFEGEVVACSLKPINFGDKRIVLDKQPGYKTMFEQILAALEASTSEIVFFCEHDVLYPKAHFDYTPAENKFYYDINWWKVRKDGLAVHWDAAQVSGLCCYRELAIKFYKERIATYDENKFDRKFEPTVETQYETWKAPEPHIDIRHGSNTTYNKWRLSHFRKKETAVNFKSSTVDKIIGWPNLSTLLQ